SCVLSARMYVDCTTCPSCRFFISSRRRHTRSKRDWSSDVCSSDLVDRVFTAQISAEDRARRIRGWNKAVRCAYGWARDEEEDVRSEERRVGKECGYRWSQGR